MIGIQLLLFLLIFFVFSYQYISKNTKYIKKQIHETNENHTIVTSMTYKVLLPFERIGNFLPNLFLRDINPETMDKIQKKLLSAGLENEISCNNYIHIWAGVIILSVFILLPLSLIAKGSLAKVVILLISIYMIFWPYIWLRDRVKLRQMKIKRELPNIISTIGMAMAVGTSFTSAVYDVTQYKTGVFVDELKRLLDEIEMGQSRVNALKRLNERVALKEVSIFTSLLIQGIEKGAYGLSDSILLYSEELWKIRVEQAREMAAKASIKLFLPLLLLVLPAMMIFILSPAIFSIINMF